MKTLNLASFAILLLLALFAEAQDVPLDVKGDTVIVVKKLPFSINAPTGFDLYFWKTPPGVVAVEKDNVLEVSAAPNGSTTVTLQTLSIDWDKKKTVKRSGLVTFVVGDVPAPKPVDPANPDTPAPIAAPGFRFMLIEETAQRSIELGNLIASAELRGFLDATCVKVAGKAEYWFLDKDQRVTTGPKLVKDALARANATPGFKVPWLIVSNGKTGFEGPLPTTKAKDLIEFVRLYVNSSVMVEAPLIPPIVNPVVSLFRD